MTSSLTTKTVKTGIEAGVATLTLNRPKEMNSLDADTARLIIDAVEGFAADTDVRVLVVAGEGPVFSAGGDFNWVLTWPSMDAITRRVGSDALMGAVQAIYDFPKPSIARVHGAAQIACSAKGGDDEHLGGETLPGYCLRHIEAREAGHLDV